MEIIFFLIMLFTGWIFFKILKFILWVLFSTDDNKTTTTHSEPVAENKMPELKYKNAVYISFVRKVYRAYESYKRAGDKVTWKPEIDGFRVLYRESMLTDSVLYEVVVCHDDDNVFNLKDPYYIKISYKFSLKKEEIDYYKDLSDYINNYYRTNGLLDLGFLIYHNVVTDDIASVGMYSCNIIISNNKVLYKHTKEHGEAAVFGMLLKIARDRYTEALELYRAKHR